MQSQEIFKGIHLSSLVSHWPKVVLGVVLVVVVVRVVVFLFLFLFLSVVKAVFSVWAVSGVLLSEAMERSEGRCGVGVAMVGGATRPALRLQEDTVGRWVLTVVLGVREGVVMFDLFDLCL